MKAISLWQPWASLIAIGYKTFETRSWSTTYRGPIAIHAAKTVNSVTDLMLQGRRVTGALNAAGIIAARVDARQAIAEGQHRSCLPLGAIVATAELAAVYATSVEPDRIPPVGSFERHCGDYRPGRFMWQLTNVHRLLMPVPCEGSQKFFNVDLPSSYPR